MSYNNKLVLVTGGSGFVGSHFVEELLSQGARVRVSIHRQTSRVDHPAIESVSADLNVMEDCLRICEDVEAVVHAAGAVSAAGVTTGANPLGPITANLILTARILEAASLQKVERILIFSSSTGYPDIRHPVKEEEFWQGPPHPSYFGYGWMRRYLECISEFVHGRTGTKVAIVRPTAVYGRYDDFNPTTSHVIPALIRRAVAKEFPFVVWGSSDVVRDFLHITDMVRGALLVLDGCMSFHPVNVGCGRPITIGELVQTILKAAGHHDVQPIFDETKPTTIPYRLADISLAKSLFHYKPGISLEEGIQDTIDWYRSKFVTPSS